MTIMVKDHFETSERRQAILTKWNSISLSRTVTVGILGHVVKVQGAEEITVLCNTKGKKEKKKHES